MVRDQLAEIRAISKIYYPQYLFLDEITNLHNYLKTKDFPANESTKSR